MNKRQLKQQVETIREAFGYTRRFKGTTFVIKIEGALIEHPLFPLLIRDIVLLHQMGIRIVLLPGARNRIDDVLATYGISTNSIGGVRISPEEAMPLIKMASFDVCNKIMTVFAENSTNAIIGNWVKARAIGIRGGVDFESSGMVETIQTDIIRTVLEQRLVPIFPNIGWNAKGRPYNISSNELAFTLGTELAAHKLFFLTASGGISGKRLRVPEGVYVSSEGFIPQMNLNQAGDFLDANASSAETTQLELVTLAYKSCRRGVSRVHIVDGRIDGIILKEIFSNRGFGTMIHANEHDNIRPMVFADIPAVLRIMQRPVDDEMLVPRSAKELEERIDGFIVYEVDGTIHGCGSLVLHGRSEGEIAAVAVDDMYANMGTGTKILSYLIERASLSRLKRVFVLTTQSSDWFEQFGFERAAVGDLPEKRRAVYNPGRKSKVLTYTISRRRVKRQLMAE